VYRGCGDGADDASALRQLVTRAPAVGELLWTRPERAAKPAGRPSQASPDPEARPMRNLLALVAFLVVTFLGAGWYLGWYKLTPVSSAPGQRSYTIDINAKKISDDVQKGVQKGGQKLNDFLESEPEKAATGLPAAGKALDAPSKLKEAWPPFRFGTSEESEPKRVTLPGRWD
jgi:hypothetical protein